MTVILLLAGYLALIALILVFLHAVKQMDNGKPDQNADPRL